MAKIHTLFVVHTTSNAANAGTNADFRLEIRRPGPNNDIVRSFPDLPHNERERGRTDYYRFDVSATNYDTSDSSEIWMVMVDTEDGWLPSSVFVIASHAEGFRVLGAQPSWPRNGWFDRRERNYASDHQIGGTSPG